MSNRLAICISGHVRTMYHAFPKSLKVIKSTNPEMILDIYAALWDKHDGRVPTKINGPDHYTADTNVTPSMMTEDHITAWLGSLVEGSVSVKMLDSNSIVKHLQDGMKLIGSVDQHLMPQYYSTHECFAMVNAAEYKYVIRIRPDIVIHNFPDLMVIDTDLITNTEMWYMDAAGPGFENEMIWISSGMVAYETARLYNSLHEGRHPGGPTHGEAMTGRHFLNIPCRKMRFNFDYRVAR